MKPFISTRNILFSVLFISSALMFSGCVYLVIGSVGALGGYAISSDTVQGTTEKDVHDVWEAAQSVVNIMGRITRQNEDSGRLEAIVDNSRVTIGVAQFTPKLARLTVKARKSFFPNIATAQDVYIKMINYLSK